MNAELRAALARDFPRLYVDAEIDVGDGWEPLLRRLGERLTTAPEQATETTDWPTLLGYVRDVKRRLSAPGGVILSFRGFHIPEGSHEALKRAETEAAATCDACGEPGFFRTQGRAVRCDAHKPPPTGLDALYARRDVSPRGPIEAAMRPKDIKDVVGQDAAIEAMLMLLDSSMPRHVILYGPPGVGKTTAARAVHAALIASPRSLLRDDSPFVEIDGSAIIHDFRNNINGLMGHYVAPTYSGASWRSRETGLADFYPGAVSKAHGGVLFIDEIGEMDPLLVNGLLKAMEDGFVSAEALGAATRAGTSDDDAEEPTEAERYIVEHGPPADFILIGATTRRPDELPPAFRSRCVPVRFRSLTESERRQIIQAACDRAKLDASTAAIAVMAASPAAAGRAAINVLAAAYSAALRRGSARIERADAERALELLSFGEPALGFRH